ncbi:MAG: stage II sporulation protein M [Cellvibrionaceae bacterium]
MAIRRKVKMRQAEFERKYKSFWDTCRKNIALLNDKKARKEFSDEELSAINSQLPSDYRSLCQHLAICKSRRYTPFLTDQLNILVKQGYDILYANKFHRTGQLLNFIYSGFPAVLQANLRFVGLAAALFLVPGILMWLASFFNEDMLYSLMDPANVRSLEHMYDPVNNKLGRERQADSDLMMFGFYIQNNIGISFRCFASGIFFGLGSIFFLVFNGLAIGGSAGHIANIGFSETFYPFVIGHGALELTAIVFSGAAGLKIGYALIAPGSYTRITALQIAAKEAIKIIYGSTIMLFIAAFIEAYWSSSSTLSITTKLSVGTVLWILVMYYCFVNRTRHIVRQRNTHAA